ncbi:MAG TPA: hypothetical protein VI485_18700 [Vicinamibacterales bacterium]|nr:hypothetical protein [Vicinamibacterales bacterium]
MEPVLTTAPDDPFSRPVCFLHSHHRFEGKRSWQACDFYAADGTPLLCAEVTGIPAEIPVRAAATNEPRLLLKPRPMFPVRGQYDVDDARTGERLGILDRNGRVLDTAERPVAIVADPVTLREQLKEGALNAVLDAALSLDGGSTAAHRADELHLHAGGRLIGTCRRTVLPFAPRSAAAASGFSPRNWLASVLPAKWAAALYDAGRPSGWRIEFGGDTANALDPRLRLAAVLLRIEIERRYQSA